MVVIYDHIPAQRRSRIDALQLLISFGCTSLLGTSFAINLISGLPLFLFAGIAFIVIILHVLTIFLSESIDCH